MEEAFMSRAGYSGANSGAFPKRGIIRERFDKEKNSVIETALGKEESWAKKVGSLNSGVLLDDIPKLLDVLGLKAVPKEYRCIDAKVYDAFRVIAATAMTDPKQLTWDEDQEEGQK